MKRKRKSLYYKIVSAILHLVVPRAKTVFEVDPGDEPVVFVSNHASINGPLMMTFYFSRRCRIWAIAEALDKTHTRSYAFHDVLVGEGKKSFGFWKFVAGVIKVALPPILIYNTITVYRDKRILETFRNSMDALKNGEDIVIFGESTERYSEYVNEIQPGFAGLGRMYFRQTGKRLRFYPVYLNKENRLISVGSPIEYDPDMDPEEFKKTVCAFIRDGIDHLGRTMKPHKPIPFLPPNWYDAYGERFEHDVAGYWHMIDTDERFY